MKFSNNFSFGLPQNMASECELALKKTPVRIRQALARLSVDGFDSSSESDSESDASTVRTLSSPERLKRALKQHGYTFKRSIKKGVYTVTQGDFTYIVKGLNHHSNEETVLKELNKKGFSQCPTYKKTITLNNNKYCVMSFAEGQPIDAVIENTFKDKDSDLIERILSSAIEGLSQIHNFGYIHHDLNPGNLIVSQDGKVTFIDWESASKSTLSTPSAQCIDLFPPGCLLLEKQDEMVCLFMLFGSLLTSSTYLNPLITKQELCTLETKLPSSESIPLFLQFSDDELKHIKYVSNDNNETQTRLMKQSMRFKYYYLAINNSDISCKEELLALVNDYYYRKFLP